MDNKNWIEKLLLFIPKSKFNVVKLWDEELNCNVIDIYDNRPYTDEHYLYYDIKKAIYNVGYHIFDTRSAYGSLYEDIYNVDLACAALLFNIWPLFNNNIDKKDGESFEDWNKRKEIFANNLFERLAKQFDINILDKELLFQYGGFLIDTKRPPKKMSIKSGIFYCKKIEVLQTAEK